MGAIGVLAEVETAGVGAGLTGVFVGEIVDSLAVERIGEFLDFVAAGDGAVADGGAFLVGGEEGGFLQAGPEGFALDAYFVGRHHW